MFSSWMKPAKCRWPTYWHVRRLGAASCFWATRSNWNNHRKVAIPKGRIFQRSPICWMADRRSRVIGGCSSKKRGACTRRSAGSLPDMFYEGRLVSHAGLERQQIDAPVPFSQELDCVVCAGYP